MTMFFSRCPRMGPSPGREPAKSGVWKKPGCSLQDLPPRGRPARPRRLNALDQEPRCSLQEDRRAVSDRVGAAADGCGRPHRDGSAGNSSDSLDELHATSAGCRRSLERIQDQSGTSCADTRYAAWPDTPDRLQTAWSGRCLEGWKACWQYGQQRGGKITSSEVCLGPNLEESRSVGARQTI